MMSKALPSLVQSINTEKETIITWLVTRKLMLLEFPLKWPTNHILICSRSSHTIDVMLDNLYHWILSLFLVIEIISVTYTQIYDIFCSLWFLKDYQLWVKNTLVSPFNILDNHVLRDTQPHKEQRGSPDSSLFYLAGLAQERGICSLLVKGLSPPNWGKLSSFPKSTVLEESHKGGQGSLVTISNNASSGPTID